MTKLRVGMLSTARINKKLAAGARASERAEVVAIASRQAGRADEQARELGVARTHGSYEALLADPEVDAVYISLPNELHHEWTMHAIAAGKHVLCEKPYSRRPADVEEAYDAAEAAGVVLAEAFMWRHHPQTLKLAELVSGGAIGDLRLVRAAFSFPLSDPADVRLLKELAGGGLMDVGCYCVSGARMLAGDPVSVTAHQLLAPSGVDRRLVATFAHAGDVLDAHRLRARPARPQRARGGRLRRRPARQRSLARHETGIDRIGLDGSEERYDVPAANPYGCELDDLAGAVAGEHEPRLGRADALGQARTIDAIYRAAESGERVTV